MSDEPVKKVYATISEVIGDLSEVGVGKNHKNTQQNFHYRAIDDVYNILGKILAKRGLVIFPNVLERVLTERETRNGGAMYVVSLKVEYQLVAASDGSSHSIVVWGEAMDSADKATNKAMSAAYKYACFQTFCIPVDNLDADADTPPETKPKKAPSVDNPKAASAPDATLELNRLASLAVEVEGATAYKDLRLVGQRVYSALQAKTLTPSHVHELALQLINKGSNVVTVKEVEGFEQMAKAFHDHGAINDQEYSVAILATRSRLNLSIDGE